MEERLGGGRAVGTGREVGTGAELEQEGLDKVSATTFSAPGT